MHSALNFRSQTRQIHYNLKSIVSATNCPRCSNHAPYLCPDFQSIQFPATAVLKPYLKDEKRPITRKHPSLIRHFQLFRTLLVLSAHLRKFPKQFLQLICLDIYILQNRAKSKGFFCAEQIDDISPLFFLPYSTSSLSIYIHSFVHSSAAFQLQWMKPMELKLNRAPLEHTSKAKSSTAASPIWHHPQ